MRARVALPGSKSITNRALVLGAIAAEPVLVRGALRARDTELMVGALRTLGVTVTDLGADLEVRPGALRGGATVDCGLAGTVMRFVPPLAGLADGPVGFDGDPRARERPLRPLLDALRTIGVTTAPREAASLPFEVIGTGSVKGGAVEIDAAASSQLVSGLLLAAPRFDGGLILRHVGKPMPSAPHVEMTVAMLRDRGVAVETEVEHHEAATWRVTPGPVRGGVVDVEPDLSNAAPFLAAAVITGGSVTVPGWPARTTQAGDRLRELLTAAGARVRLTDAGLEVNSSGAVAAFDADLHDVGELVPVLAAVAALADGPSHLRGIAHLRGHETDRLAALAAELGGLGAKVTELPDGLRVEPRPLRGGAFRTYDDHRMVMAAAVLGLAVPGVEIENVETVGKTLPGFVGLWRTMLAGG